MKILISGTSSGLGKFLYRNIESKKFIRNKDKIKKYKKKMGCNNSLWFLYWK